MLAYKSNAICACLDAVAAILLIAHVELSSCQELSLRRIIENRPELTILASDVYIQNTDVMAYLGNTDVRSTVFFAPNNDAFKEVEFKYQLRYSVKSTINNIFQYHLIPSNNSTGPFNPYSLSNGQQTKAFTQYGSTYIFASKFNETIYINGAKIIIPNLSATNGVVHIINKIFVTFGPAPLGQSGLIGYDYVTDRVAWEMSKLFRIFEDYQLRGTILASGKYPLLMDAVLKNPNAFCTIFVPSNDFVVLFKSRNQDMYSKISGMSPSLLKQVVESLIIPTGAYHSTLLEDLTDGKTLEAVNGQIRAYQIDGKRYVTNRCGQAQILTEDITTSNCVVHVIDNFLGLVTKDLYNETITQTDLQEFSRAVLLAADSNVIRNLKAKGGSEYVVPDSEKFTIFAPTNSIFTRVDFSRNANERIQQLSMVISPGVLDLSLIKGTTTIDTMREGYKAVITKEGNSFYVEVNHVKAKITMGNICTTNGMIHKIDRIVGLSEGTIGDYLNWNVQFQRLGVIIKDTGLYTICINPTVQVTLFAPNESAIMTLDPKFQGQQNKNKLTKLMSTHVSPVALYMDSIAEGSEVTLQTHNGKVKVSRSNGEYWVAVGDEKVRVLQANMGASNGVMHVIEHFLPYVYDGGERISENVFLMMMLFSVALLCRF